MKDLIHHVALLASLMALIAGLWQDWEILATFKRMLGSYLVFFGVGACLALAVRFFPLLEEKSRPRDLGPTTKRTPKG
jgi:hypothetical protein